MARAETGRMGLHFSLETQSEDTAVKIKDLVSLAATYPETYDMKVFVGWREVTDVQIRADRVYPYVELVLEDNGDGEDHF